MRIRGFDSYEVKLGDEIRGVRATFGKSLQDAGRDLKIEAQLIAAIEDCDHNRFPNQNIVAGYVRSYAKYLCLDSDRCYRQFCKESGFKSPSTINPLAISGARSRAKGLPESTVGKGLTEERFATFPVVAQSMNFPIPVRAIFSFAALTIMLAGLGYGGYSVMNNIQQVGFAPTLESPNVVAEAPKMTLLVSDGIRHVSESVNHGESGVRAPIDLSNEQRLSRDGPISEIDPESYGAFFAIAPEIDVFDETASAFSEPVFAEASPMVAVHTVQDAWVRIVNDSNVIVFHGVLRPGQSVDVPDSIIFPKIYVGDAGSVYTRVNGENYGPVGEPGQVITGFLLTAETIRANLPKVDDFGVGEVVVESEDHYAATGFEQLAH